MALVGSHNLVRNLRPGLFPMGLKNKALRHIVFFVVTCSALPVVSAVAQQIPSNPITDPNLTTGIQPYSNLPSDTENVNLANGDVSVSIPLVSLSGINGMNLNLAVNYDSKNVSLYSHYQTGYWGYLLNWASNDYAPDFAGGTLSIPRLNFSYDLLTLAQSELGSWAPIFARERFYFTDTSGGRHSFANQRDISSVTGLIVNGNVQPEDISDSADGANLRLNTTGWPIVKVYQKDGTVITFNIPSQYQSVGGPAVYAAGLYPSSIADRNGNTITFTPTSAGLNITDTLGRVVTIGSGTISYYDANHNLTTWTEGHQNQTVTTPAIGTTFCKAVGPAPDPNGGSGILNPTSPEWSGLLQGVFSLTQSNSASSDTRTYTVTLDNLGEPVKITYPTGGYTAYTFGALSFGPYEGDSNGDTQCSRNLLKKVPVYNGALGKFV